MREINKAPCPELAGLIDKDDLIYSVLRRILRTPCRYTVTDDARVILCHSDYPYPFWLWTATELSEEEKEKLFEYGKNAYLTWDAEKANGTAFRINADYTRAEEIVRRAKADNLPLDIVTNLHAYDCPETRAYDKEVDGAPRMCVQEDTATALIMMRQFFAESLVDKLTEEEFRQKTEIYIYARRLYFWENEAHVPCAMCAYIDNGDGSESVNNVVTMPSHRRKGYAAKLVSHVTEIIRKRGHRPMLYTDADYLPANACYEKIGYVKRGSLCTLGVKS